MKHYQFLVFVLLLFSACANVGLSTIPVTGNWSGTLTDGTAIALTNVRGNVDISATLQVANEASRALKGSYAENGLSLQASDALGTVIFSAIVSEDAMTGSLVRTPADGTATSSTFNLSRQ